MIIFLDILDYITVALFYLFLSTLNTLLLEKFPSHIELVVCFRWVGLVWRTVHGQQGGWIAESTSGPLHFCPWPQRVAHWPSLLTVLPDFSH